MKTRISTSTRANSANSAKPRTSTGFAPMRSGANRANPERSTPRRPASTPHLWAAPAMENTVTEDAPTSPLKNLYPSWHCYFDWWPRQPSVHIAQPLPRQLAMLINGIRLARRAKKVWVREMTDAKKEWRWLQRQLLRALARRMGLFAPTAVKRRVLPAHKGIRGATAQRFARR